MPYKQKINYFVIIVHNIEKSDVRRLPLHKSLQCWYHTRNSLYLAETSGERCAFPFSISDHLLISYLTIYIFHHFNKHFIKSISVFISISKMISLVNPSSILLLCSCLSLLMHHSFGCSCLARSFEQYYSESTITVVANVTSESIICDPEPVNMSCHSLQPFERQFYQKLLYHVNVSTVLKGSLPTCDNVTLQTEYSSGLCGTSLSVGTTYLLNLVDMSNEYFVIGSCSGIFVFDQLTDSEKMFYISKQ